MTSAQKTILIVDDEEDLTWSISRSVIRENRPINVICVNSGSDALDLLRTEKVDLLITDLRMPGVTGINLIEYIYENMLDTRIIVVSAYSPAELLIKNLMSDRCRYLEKPFEMTTLKGKIFEMLEEETGVDNVRTISQIRRLAIMTKGIDNMRVTVFHGEESGQILFSNGIIRHAESGERIGKEALREILNWQDCRLKAEVMPNITKDLAFSLLPESV